MGKSLVIVESPAKAKTINKYLGSEYIVKSSVGHIRDLPVSGSGKTTAARTSTKGLTPEEKKHKAQQQLFARMGVNPEDGWTAHYEILPGKEKVVDELKKLAKNADMIYLATDLDREGEAIAWHLRETLGGDDSRYRRVVFNEITKKAITQAFESPSRLDMNRVHAQQARRFLDRVVGYMVSPLLWSKVARGLSAGRVQSVAVRLIVEREREIRAFIPEEYWDVTAHLQNKKAIELACAVAKKAGKAFRPNSKAETDAALAELQPAVYTVADREDKPTSSRPSAPFITSTLQQAASTRLGFSVKKTMTLAQRLYEAGHITYMRTDSTNLSQDAVAACRDWIAQELGKEYLPDTPQVYSSKDGAQEAHEAIRPSSVKMQGKDLGSAVERDAQRLYELIWRQFVACQMPPARYLSTTLKVTAEDYELKAKGRVLQFDGFTRIQPVSGKQGEDQVLPDLKVGETLDLQSLDPRQHFTKPPARFTEAALVKELEKQGIGRPSTYAAIISTIQDRGYAKVENRRFYAEKMGDIVTDRLVESFQDLLDFSFTARMENSLDAVAQGEEKWVTLLDKFYTGFKKQLEKAQDTTEGMRPNQPVDTDIPCPTCGRHMQIRIASTGTFLGCSGYALPPKERCKTTINLVSADEFVGDDDDEQAETNALRAKRRCQVCGTAMESFIIDEKRKLHVCGNSPDCTGYQIEEGTFRLKGYEGPTLDCDKCGSEMQLKTGRFGKYFGCTNSECKNTRKLLRSGEAAPPKMDPVPMPELKCLKVEDHYVLRDGASGIFLAASQFPKMRETRPPLVSEIKPHKAEIDPKHHYLLEAPEQDTEGNPTVIRYSRKNKEQYVQAEKDGKATGFRAFYDGSKWVVEDKPKAKPKAKPKPKAAPKKAAANK
ncbi:type I DNA topoisomerase [Marinospirillum minutulum]|uniref:type I DNA topoisomerase n=1 Tax=Marinospirillum minutulum TaxID=64974 RepID=UPI0003F9B8A7|nr:type I DNA topoisomerase [Marinospirillum minutulum]